MLPQGKVFPAYIESVWGKSVPDFSTSVVGWRTLLAGAPLNMTEFPKLPLLKNLFLSQDLQLVHQNPSCLLFLVVVAVVMLLLPVAALFDVLRRIISLSQCFWKASFVTWSSEKALFLKLGSSADSSESRRWNSTLWNLLAMSVVTVSSMSMIGFLNPPDLRYLVFIFEDFVKARSPLKQPHNYREPKIKK